ncbi:MAG TPA: xanthine dehydrogenase family protein subunit M [Pseudonocardia sp.]|jgi:xanthine dehydrogenase YagS FAD-binding subunit|nr:xanthine dehydrogenase family protein subunit M [Pseudonocardia sp.]
MRSFTFAAPGTLEAASDEGRGGATYLAGGTTLVDLMKLEVLTPNRVADINALPLRGIRVDSDGLHIGALERMSTVATHPAVRTAYPMVSRALLASASQQLRNMASMGGNLLQRTRCGYYRDTAEPCNRRVPGSGCPAVNGANRSHAILGTSDACAATHASDVAVALVALDASVRLRGAAGERLVRLADFYRLPGNTPQLEHDLRPAELVTELVIPPLPWAQRSGYLKVRDRQSYEFALCSAAVALDLAGRQVRDVRIAVGGVGTVPWRLPSVEAALRGAELTEDSAGAAAKLAVAGARPLAHNGFKTTLLQRTLVRALLDVGGVL